MPELKSFGALEVKSAERGEVEAIVATLGVVDRDQEVILPGAIADGSKVKLSSYGHDAMFGGIPVGKGALRIAGNRAIFQGKLFLGTVRGKETFDVLREMGADQSWSFGFVVQKSEPPSEEWRSRGARRMLTRLDAFEVSPVIVGAGVGTQTLSVKGAPEPFEAAAEYQAFKQRETLLYGCGDPPPDGLKAFIEFTADRLGIPRSKMPAILMVPRFDDQEIVGDYSPVLHRIRVLVGRKDLDTRRTLGHELSHAREMLDGREYDEEYARISAEWLLAEWRSYCRRDQ